MKILDTITIWKISHKETFRDAQNSIFSISSPQGMTKLFGGEKIKIISDEKKGCPRARPGYCGGKPGKGQSY